MSLFVLIPGSLDHTFKNRMKLQKDQRDQETNQRWGCPGRKHVALFAELGTVWRVEWTACTRGSWESTAQRPGCPRAEPSSARQHQGLSTGTHQLISTRNMTQLLKRLPNICFHRATRGWGAEGTKESGLSFQQGHLV